MIIIHMGRARNGIEITAPLCLFATIHIYAYILFIICRQKLIIEEDVCYI